MRQSRIVIAAAAAALLGSALVTTGASASPVSKTADSTWQTDGRVNAVAYSPDGTTLYLGGVFSHLCPALQKGCDGTGPSDLTVHGLAAVDAATGQPRTGFHPEPDGEVSALVVSPDGGTLYAGGAFSHMNGTGAAGEVHRKLAAVSTSTGLAASAWSPVINSSVQALALSPDASTLYFGGAFTTVNGAQRLKLAAAGAYSSASPAFTLLGWAPDASGSRTVDKRSTVPPTVNSLAVRPEGDVYAGGVFTTIAGAARNNVAALSPATGGGAAVARPFALRPELNYIVLTVSLTRDGSTLFVNGRGPGGFVWAVDSVTGSQRWTRHFDGDVQAAVATDTVVYVGGHFDFLNISGSSLRDERHHLAALDAFTGQTDPFNPKANSVFGVYGMAFTPGHLAAAGDFTLVNGIAHEGLAQFSGGDTVPPAAVTDLAATSTAKGRVDLSWSPVADSDSPDLAYYVYRRPAGGTPSDDRVVAKVPAASAPGTGSITASDTSGTVGSSYTYQVRAADPVFLAQPGTAAGATVVGDQAPPLAPSGVSATSPSPGNVDVTWTGGGDADDTSLTYTLTRSDGVARTVTGAATGSVTTRDTAGSGGTFTWTVTAGDGTFTSPTSNPSAPLTVAADVAAPTAPTSLAATSPGPDTVTLSWAAAGDADTPVDQLTYRVFRRLTSATGTGGTTPVAVTGPGQTTFTDTVAGGTGLLADRDYTYYVQTSDGPKTSAKSAPAAVVVGSLVLTDPLDSLAAWTLPDGARNGVTLDPAVGGAAAPSAALQGRVTSGLYGYMSRSFTQGAFRTVCASERFSVGALDTRSTGQTTLLRLFSSTGNDISRVFVDNVGKLWVRGDWGSYPVVTTTSVPADGSWHSVQLCTTTTSDAVSGTVTGYYDGVKVAAITGVDNSTDPLGSLQVGDSDARNFLVHVDDVSVGTTPR